MAKIIPFKSKNDELCIDSSCGDIVINSTAYIEDDKLLFLLSIKDLTNKMINDIVHLEKPVEDGVVVHLYWYNKLRRKINEYDELF